jgi:hypothetical protein
MLDTWTLTLDKPDRYGREQVRTVNLTIDIRDFKDKAIFPYLVMAANLHLSMREIQDVLLNVGEQHFRPLGWLSRVRWLIHGKGSKGKSGAKRNADGLDEKAYSIMGANPRLSSRQLVYLLRENGIRRSREWVRKHRVPAQAFLSDN